MRPVSLPEIPYSATAVRPNWEDLPTAVRDAITHRLGAPVASATSATSGFTTAFAGLLTSGPGERVFVKAAPFGNTSHAYAREAHITAALPSGVRAARPRWTLEVAGHYVLCLDAIDGHIPALPWSPASLAATLTAWRTAADALSHPPAPLRDLPRLTDLVRDELSWWTPVAAGRAPIPALPPWALSHLDELAGLEQRLPPLVAGTGVTHGDLRVDNVMIDPTGDAWLCDWTWPCLGAPWFDTVTLLVSAWASGLDADTLIASWKPPPGGVDGTLAAMSGYWLTRAAGSTGTAAATARQHHAYSGVQALTWLAERRGWSTRFGGAKDGLVT
ncbi:phosphotransferase family protein [Actinoplanes sp. NPDC049265]|uniref:phosphotransferase family protein n=1 Tax=Actinoplanes sp. NPDC049265 TaxID=3363902 RepID=UPI0037239E0E